MFCPPGYALIEDIFPRILDRSYVVSTDHDLKPDDEVGQYIKHSLNAMFALQMFLESCPSLSVCSPDGVVLRVSRRILTRLLTDGKKSDHRYFECIDEETWLVDVEAWERPTQASSSVDMVVEALLRKQRNRANFFSRFSTLLTKISVSSLLANFILKTISSLFDFKTFTISELRSL